MNVVESMRATAEELVTFAHRAGCDLEIGRTDCLFHTDQRWISLWRENGLLRYSLQGSINVLPHRMKDSASLFQGGWIEGGTFDNIEQAFECVKAWLVDGAEVDDLPPRHVIQYGI